MCFALSYFCQNLAPSLYTLSLSRHLFYFAVDFVTLSYTEMTIFLRACKGHPFRVEPPRKTHYRENPPPPGVDNKNQFPVQETVANLSGRHCGCSLKTLRLFLKATSSKLPEQTLTFRFLLSHHMQEIWFLWLAIPRITFISPTLVIEIVPGQFLAVSQDTQVEKKVFNIA